MKKNHSVALIAAYYLSKFDDKAYEFLDFGTKKETHAEIGRILDVNPNSIKNMRDAFDPLHDNPRAGWYQRPLRPSRAKVVEGFQGLSELELRDVVLEILTNPDFSSSDDFADIIDPIAKRAKNKKGKGVFAMRGPTGRKAEELFVAYHESHQLPAAGTLIDTRDLGCGYDFEIENGSNRYQVEVKGIYGETGGVLLTSKEWDTAKVMGDSFFLVVIRNVSDTPSYQIVQNPAATLNPKKQIYTTVQVSWTVGSKDLVEVGSV